MKDCSLRFCVDYRKLNDVTVRDSYPIRMDEYIDTLGDAQVFITLDANCGYWKVEIDEADRDKTTFTSHHGLYRFIRMPFGLKNAPGTFQRATNVILSTAKWQYSLIYLDDIVVFSKEVDEHMTHLRKVLSLLSEAGLTLKLKKCQFFTDKIVYLGHVIRPGRLEIAYHTTDAIRGLKNPTTVTELKYFLGLCNFFRRFVPNFARTAASLNAMLQKDQPRTFGPLSETEKAAIAELQRLLIKPPVLMLPKSEGKFTVDTDACDKQVGCVFLQDQPDGKPMPIGCWSRSLNKEERG